LPALTARTQRRRVWWGAAAALLLFELSPMPRRLYPAGIPPIYKIVQADARPVNVLELPFGLRDGLSSLGDFTAASQFFQTFHEKPLYGGYLSRISDARKKQYMQRPVLGALMRLSQRLPLSADDRRRAAAASVDFVARNRLGYVVIDRSRAPAGLRDFAVAILRLKSIASSGERELLIPQ